MSTPDRPDSHGRELTKENWKALFEDSAVAVIICDEEGCIRLLNAQAERVFGYMHEEIIGKTIDILLPSYKRLSQGMYRKQSEKEKGQQFTDSRKDMKGLHKDGSAIPLSIDLSRIAIDGADWHMVIIHDLTEQYQMIERLHLLGAALEATANGIAITDTHGVCQWINPGFSRITGYTSEEIVGQPVSKLKSGFHSEDFFKELWSTISSGKTWHGEIHNRHKDGTIYIEEQSISPVLDRNGGISHYIAVKQDVTERREIEQKLQEANLTLHHQLAEIEILQERLREQAIRDPLTGLYNRRIFNDFLDRDLAHAHRGQSSFTVVLIDIDHFKKVNDTFGHHAGDDVLRAISHLLQSQTRATDTVCRFGGEEFILIFPGMALEEAVRRVETMRKTFEEMVVEHEGQQICATFSAGIAVYPDHGVNGNAVVSAADRALYRAKSAGRNCVVTSDEVTGDEPLLYQEPGE